MNAQFKSFRLIMGFTVFALALVLGFQNCSSGFNSSSPNASDNSILNGQEVPIENPTEFDNLDWKTSLPKLKIADRANITLLGYIDNDQLVSQSNQEIILTNLKTNRSKTLLSLIESTLYSAFVFTGINKIYYMEKVDADEKIYLNVFDLDTNLASRLLELDPIGKCISHSVELGIQKLYCATTHPSNPKEIQYVIINAADSSLVKMLATDSTFNLKSSYSSSSLVFKSENSLIVAATQPPAVTVIKVKLTANSITVVNDNTLDDYWGNGTPSKLSDAFIKVGLSNSSSVKESTCLGETYTSQFYPAGSRGICTPAGILKIESNSIKICRSELVCDVVNLIDQDLNFANSPTIMPSSDRKQIAISGSTNQSFVRRQFVWNAESKSLQVLFQDLPFANKSLVRFKINGTHKLLIYSKDLYQTVHGPDRIAGIYDVATKELKSLPFLPTSYSLYIANNPFVANGVAYVRFSGCNGSICKKFISGENGVSFELDPNYSINYSNYFYMRELSSQLYTKPISNSKMGVYLLNPLAQSFDLKFQFDFDSTMTNLGISNIILNSKYAVIEVKDSSTGTCSKQSINFLNNQIVIPKLENQKCTEQIIADFEDFGLIYSSSAVQGGSLYKHDYASNTLTFILNTTSFVPSKKIIQTDKKYLFIDKFLFDDKGEFIMNTQGDLYVSERNSSLPGASKIYTSIYSYDTTAGKSILIWNEIDPINKTQKNLESVTDAIIGADPVQHFTQLSVNKNFQLSFDDGATLLVEGKILLQQAPWIFSYKFNQDSKKWDFIVNNLDTRSSKTVYSSTYLSDLKEKLNVFLLAYRQ